MTLVIVDAAHLLAAASRSLGLGAPRRAGRFDLVRLTAVLTGLAPSSDPVAVHWFDALPAGGEPDDLRRLRESGAAEVRTVPLRGGRQRHLEAVVLKDVLRLAAEDPAGLVLLVGDPRRHALTLETAAEQDLRLRLVGVGEGETTPAPRWWVRRTQLAATVRDRRPAPAGLSGYRRPGVRTSPVTLPRD